MNTAANKIKVIHVDDEQSSLDNLKSILLTFENVEYCKGFKEPMLAVEFAKENAIDIIFCDIEMKKHDGFWLANELKDDEITIVFVSNHSEYAIKAFEACSLHYLVKPATKIDIEECLRRFEKYRKIEQAEQSTRIAEVAENYLDATKYPKRLFIFNVEKTHIIDIEKLMYAKAMTTYTKFIMQDGKEIMSSKNIKVYDDALVNHPQMLRVHRSVMVNKKFVSSIRRQKHLAFLILENGEEVEISLYKKDEILRRLEF
jgi:two-component system, LytTR family, response regulator